MDFSLHKNPSLVKNPSIVDDLDLTKKSTIEGFQCSSFATFKFWNWTFPSSKTQSDKPEVTLISKNDEGKIIIVLN